MRSSYRARRGGMGSPLDLDLVDFTDISPKYFHHLYTDIAHEVLYNTV